MPDDLPLKSFRISGISLDQRYGLWPLSMRLPAPEVPLDHSADQLQKQTEQQKAETSDKQSSHPGASFFFRHQRQEERNEPEKQCNFQDHCRGLYSDFEKGSL
jgi:hypothetical protein